MLLLKILLFSFLKLVHIFSVSPHLGPLQISLSRMIIDIVKFFFIYTLVLFAFGCGTYLKYLLAHAGRSVYFHKLLTQSEITFPLLEE